MYRYFCHTENKQIYDNSCVTPTKCINNDDHIIDKSSIVKLINLNCANFHHSNNETHNTNDTINH
jgi:hypothetical protein